MADLVEVLNGRAYKKTELLDSGTPVLRVGNLFTSNQWYYSNLTLEKQKYCESGDLLFAWSASFGPFIWSGERVIYHYHIWKLDLHSETDLSKRYLYTFLLQKTAELKRSARGVSMVHLTKEAMERVKVPLPPLAEQHRIVAKVDELMALLDQLEAARKEREAARDRLTAATLARLSAPDPDTFEEDARFALEVLPALSARVDHIGQLKRSVLSLAVRGKLVPQLPGASEYDQQPMPSYIDAEGRMDLDLPRGWRWARVGDVASARLGKMLDRNKNRGRPFRYLGNTNVHWFDIRCENLKSIQLESDETDTYLLKSGDVLICEGGHGIGRTAVWRAPETDVAFQKALHRVRPGPLLDSDFFAACCYVYFHSGVMQQYFTGVGIPHFTGKALAQLVFPLPPLLEQQRIVAKVNELMGVCDHLAASLETESQIRARLLDGLLQDQLVAIDSPSGAPTWSDCST